jgi:uncharacterized repeat protein (TIGR01451 family)
MVKIKLTSFCFVMFLLLGILVGCGGGGGGGDGGTSTPAAPQVARLEITPSGAMLTKAGETQAFSAKAFDAENHQVQANITWTSSNPANAAVDSSGKVTAVSDLGSTQIVVQVGDLKSAPALITVAQPAPGVILLTDAQVIGEPMLVDPNAEDDIENLYEVLITGISPPAPGSLLLGRESKAVGGEVISSQPEGNAVRVRLKLTSLDQLVQAAKIEEVLDFTKLKMVLPPEVTNFYDIQNIDGEYVFTPKPHAVTQSGTAKARPQAMFEKQLGPFKCEYGTPELPISLSQPATFRIKLDPTLELKYDKSQGGLQKLIVRASTSFEMSANLTLNAAGLVNVICDATIFDKTLPAPGFAGLLLASQVKAGLGFEIEGNLTVPLLGAELTSETKGDLEVGLDCTKGKCNLVKKFEPTNTNQIRFITPDVANVRTELFVFGYGFAKLKGGMTLIEKMRTDVVTVRGGAKFEGSLAPTATQVAPNNSTLEPDYKSSYKLSLLADVVVGPANKADNSAINKLLFKLGVVNLNFFKFQTSKPLSISPKGTAELNKASFKTGDAVKFHVDLDPDTVQFLGVGYNIDNISILQHIPGNPPREIANVSATDGQISFDLSWVADANSENASGQNFYAFVNTKIPSIFDIELANVLRPTGEATPNADAGSLYTVTAVPLGVLTGFNDSGQVIGRKFDVVQWVFWDSSTGTITDLSVTVPGITAASSLNNAGHFIGQQRIAGIFRPVFVKGTTVIPLPEDFSPHSLNNNDQIAGVLFINDFENNTGHEVPAIWQAGNLTQTPISFGTSKYSVAVNDLGHTASAYYSNASFCDRYLGFIQSDRLFSFKAPYDSCSVSIDSGTVVTLNNKDELIVSYDGVGHLMRNHQFVPKTPQVNEHFVDINDSGDVVGNAGTEPYSDGFLWPEGNRDAPVILKSARQGWDALPAAINNNKQILAYNLLNSQGPILLTPKSPEANLEISMIAQDPVAPNSNITYAVNLQNKSETGASNVRVEFSLPEDFAIIDSVGWSGCTTVLTTITCKLEKLAANERRAFLVNVKASADAGFYVMQARVGADENDPDFGNNSNVGITEIR